MWLASNPRKLGGSWQRDEIVVRVHILPVLGSRPVGSLTPGDVQSLVNGWAAKHAPETVRREYGVLRAILNHALANDMVGRSPCRRIKLPEVAPVRRHIIDGEQLGRLAAAMGGVEGYGTMAYLGTVDGLRWGEVAGLRVGQFDFEAGTVHITQTVVRTGSPTLRPTLSSLRWHPPGRRWCRSWPRVVRGPRQGGERTTRR
jgi:integrase